MRIDGEHLRRLRRHRKLGLEQLALIIGKSRAQIWRYENNKSNMSAATLLRLAEYFGVPIGQLVTDKPCY